jgi:methylmalonyl-CoA mutase cobalamin-binding subunit
MVRVLVGGLAPGAVRELRDGGHEVVLVETGVSAERLAASAIQEDVVAIAVLETDSDLDPGDVAAALAAYDADDIVVFAAG